ncbi:hypothetical protein [Photobacterium marinum]|nr:hypothetical protein [Photobacterium marinum]
MKPYLAVGTHIPLRADVMLNLEYQYMYMSEEFSLNTYTLGINYLF